MKAFLTVWIKFQKTEPVMFYSLLFGLLAAGLSVALNSEIEAFPDLTNVQVQVITQYPGKASEEVERQVTVPLEAATNGVPGLINQRSISIFGLSVITLTFDDEVKSRQARIDIAQRLGDADLPDGVKPALSPDSTPVGEIFRYTVVGSVPPDEMRMIEDWTLERAFKAIPGVADVVSFGGPVRVIEVKIDLIRLKALGLSITQVAQSLGQNSANAGGSIVTHGDESYIVRSIGLYENPESLESAVIATQKGVPIRVRDVGSVRIGNRPRLGQVARNENDDTIEGIILLRMGGDTLGTCKEIREKIDHLNESVLPNGVKIVPFYDRTNLIERSSYTVFHNIIFGIFLVCLLLFLGFGARYWTMIMGVCLIIPLALIAAFVGVQLMGYKPNLISLGAVDFGIIVETAIFASEAVIVALQRQKKRDEDELVNTLEDVLMPALLCALLLLVAFVPILSLKRVEGRIFRPLGITLVSALIGGQLGALIFIPLFMHFSPIGAPEKLGKFWQHVENGFGWVTEKMVSTSLKVSAQPKLVLKSAIGFTLLIALLMWGLGREFLPNLNEGSLYIRSTAPPTISLPASVELAGKIRKKLFEIPEVVDVVSQVGRPDDGTDVNGFDNIETFVVLKPQEEWKSAKTIDGMTKVAQEKMGSFTGVDFNFSQPIKDNVDEAISGVKGELVLKVFGTNVEQLQKTADQIRDLLSKIPGAQDVASEQLLSQPELRFKVNHELLARYGLKVTDAEDVLETALNGKSAGKIPDEQGRLTEIMVKPNLPEQPTRELLASLPVVTPDGAKIPLSEVTYSSLVEGVSRIYRESGERRIAVKCSVRGRAVVDFVNEASALINKEVKLPPKFRTQWSGSFENANRAGVQLMIIVPLCLLVMMIILFTWFKSWTLVGLLLWEIPFSLVGGLFALRLFQLNLSVSAAVGGIVLIGVSFLTGMMLIFEWIHLKDPFLALKEKSRSILISSGVAIIGLIPASFSTGIGSETAKPFAVMILGGLMTTLLFTLLLLPALMKPSHLESLPRND